MFEFLRRSSDEEESPPLSVIGERSTATGSVDLEEGDLRVDGTLEGDVQTEGHVHITQGGAIQGEIRAGSIRVAGTATGVLCAQQSLVVLGSSEVYGILCGESLTIEEGAGFEGGICRTAERIPELKAVFSSTDAYAMPDLLSSQHEAPPKQPPRPFEPIDQTASPEAEQLSPSENGEIAHLARQEEPIQGSDPSPVSHDTDDAVVENETREKNGVNERSEIKW